MPGHAERSRNNVRAGVFMLVSILLGLAVVMSLSDVAGAFFQQRRSYVVEFDVASGVDNLQPGSSVRVGGLAMGNVESVEPVKPGGSSAFGEVIRVEFSLDDRFDLFTDAGVYVAGPLIGSEAWLEIISFGTGPTRADLANAIQGRATSMIEALIGADGGRILANVAAFTEELAAYDEQIDKILADTSNVTGNISESSGDIRELVQRINDEDWPDWAGRVTAFLTWTNEVTADLDAAVDAGHELLESANAVIADNRTSIDATMQNVEDTTGSAKRIAERIEQYTIAQAEELLGKAGRAVDSANGVLEDISVDYPQWGASLTHTMANANLASQQLKLALQEVRRNPWKLLYQPDPGELDYELLYDAARSFSLATIDLRAASESLERSLAKHGDALGDRADLADRLSRGVVESLENYERAQRRLFEVLKLDAAGSTP